MLRFLGWSLVVVLLDQASKFWMIDHFRQFETLYVWPVFNLTLVYNPGAAFSFLANAGGWQYLLFVGLAALAVIAMTVWLARLDRTQRLLGWALALMIAGATGNLVDRLVHGEVVDFLQFHWGNWYFPSFNLADSAITLGVILLLLDGLVGDRRHD